MNFEVFLVVATLFAGLCYALAKLLNWIAYTPSRSFKGINEYLASFFPMLLILLLIRSFVTENYRIPSGSQKPTLLVGDFLIANKFVYGLRLPISGKCLIPYKQPKRGDVIAFRSPFNSSIYFIKRVVGLPGDHIRYHEKVLIINGKAADQRVIGVERDEEGNGRYWPVLRSEEDLEGYKHAIYTRLEFQNETDINASKVNIQDYENMEVTVPKGHYMMIGDNRDNSFDSRHWGFVSDAQLLGQAKWIFFSWDSEASWGKPLTWVRWKRIGMKII